MKKSMKLILLLFWASNVFAADSETNYDFDQMFSNEQPILFSETVIDGTKFEEEAEKGSDIAHKRYQKMVEAARKTSQPINNPNSNYCHSSYLSESDKNLCLAKSLSDQSYCFSGRLDKSKKALCLGMFESSNCHSMDISKNDQQLCLAISNNDSSFCYSRDIYGMNKVICEGHFNQSRCYSSSDNRTRDLCIGLR